LVLAHNSVDRELMARDSIELTQYDDVVSTPRARTNRSANSELKLGASAYSRTLTEDDMDGEPRPKRSRSRAAGVRNEDDSELLIHPEDMNLDDVDGEDSQFLRTNKRVPVRRSPIPKKAANTLMTAAWIAAAVVVAAGLWAWAYSYGIHSWRFRIESSDSVEITGVHNASRAQVMEVAGQDIGRNIFFVPLDERQKQLEQIPWVEHASVMRLLPNRISVTIDERVPVAFAQIGPRISLIDAGGVVMGLPANRQIKYSFPVIRGIAETEPLSSRAAAMKIYNRLISELSADDTAGTNGAVSASTSGPTNYVKQLSEVDLSDPEDVKVTANDAGGTMVVHLGAQDFLPRYKLYVTHIAEWRQQYQNVQSVDLRYEGQVVVNPDKPVEANLPRRHGDAEKTTANVSPQMNADKNDQKKPVLKPVSAKPAVATTKPEVAKPSAPSAKPAATNTKPAATTKPSVVKPVVAKPTAKSPKPAAANTKPMAANTKPAVAKTSAKPAVKPVTKKTTGKTVAKKTAGKPSSKKVVAKKPPQKTQTAQK
jgi:cell division protein FtsQ